MSPIDQNELDDDALVTLALAGDDRAFEALLDRHDRVVVRVLGLLGVRAADREDLAQEVLVRVFRHLAGFRRGRKFSNWIYRIAVNVARDHRDLSRRNPAEPDAYEPTPDSEVHPGLGPERQLQGRELALQLEVAVARLSPRERDVFVLHEMEELTSKEVAGVLGITQITVRRHLSRARESLRKILEESHDSD